MEKNKELLENSLKNDINLLTTENKSLSWSIKNLIKEVKTLEEGINKKNERIGQYGAMLDYIKDLSNKVGLFGSRNFLKEVKRVLKNK